MLLGFLTSKMKKLLKQYLFFKNHLEKLNKDIEINQVIVEWLTTYLLSPKSGPRDKDSERVGSLEGWREHPQENVDVKQGRENANEGLHYPASHRCGELKRNPHNDIWEPV